MRHPEDCVIDRPQDGVFDVHRDVFRDPALFDLEMQYIFEGTWAFLGLEIQFPAPHDFITTTIGRQPVIVSRDGEGRVHAFLNSCRHRGALVCHHESGNARQFTCSYHGWSYDSSGANIAVKDQGTGHYSAAYLAADKSLKPLARVESYRGLVFGSLVADVPSLDEHLGGTRTFIDLVLDQSPQGLEIVPGVSTYTFNANWKTLLENTVDGYHVTSTHPSFMKIVERRGRGESRGANSSMDFNRFGEVSRGSFTFDRGHMLIWGGNPSRELRPLNYRIDEVRERVGQLRAEWMLNTRNLTVYPNLQIAEIAALQLRTIRPLAVDRTEATTYCIAPVGEPPEARALRLRQFEDFYNSSGFATPDDSVNFEDCQAGYRAHGIDWQQGYGRGMGVVRRGPDEFARELGISPATSMSGPFQIQDETVIQAGYREWLRLMRAGLARDGQAGGGAR